jgi:hypothetical protein
MVTIARKPLSQVLATKTGVFLTTIKINARLPRKNLAITSTYHNLYSLPFSRMFWEARCQFWQHDAMM